MGRMLQIRVAAQTFDPVDVEKAWPRLVALSWPPMLVQGSGKLGVMELTGALFDAISMGDWPEETKTALRPGIAKGLELKNKLEAALADWNPREADKLSYALEDTLDELERKVPTP